MFLFVGICVLLRTRPPPSSSSALHASAIHQAGTGARRSGAAHADLSDRQTQTAVRVSLSPVAPDLLKHDWSRRWGLSEFWFFLGQVGMGPGCLPASVSAFNQSGGYLRQQRSRNGEKGEYVLRGLREGAEIEVLVTGSPGSAPGRKLPGSLAEVIQLA